MPLKFLNSIKGNWDDTSFQEMINGWYYIIFYLSIIVDDTALIRSRPEEWRIRIVLISDDNIK